MKTKLLIKSLSMVLLGSLVMQMLSLYPYAEESDDKENNKLSEYNILPDNTARISSLTDGENGEFSDSECYFEKTNSSIRLDTKLNYFLDTYSISIAYIVDSKCNIEAYELSDIVDCSDLSTFIDESDKNRIILNLTCHPNSESCHVTIHVKLSNMEELTSNFCAFTNEYGTFISAYDGCDAYEEFLYYAESEHMITKEEHYDRLQDYLRRSGCVEESITVLSPICVNDVASTESSGTIDVKGTMKWIDNQGNEHPLQYLMIKIYDYDVFNRNDLLGETYTDENGRFFCTVNNDEDNGQDVFIQMFAGDDNVCVMDLGRNKYCYKSQREDDTASGTELDFSCRINMSTQFGQAFQISQAILTMREYYKEITKKVPSPVKVYYPDTDKKAFGYDSQYQQIFVLNDSSSHISGHPYSYASWDALMHEYAHHIMSEMGMDSDYHGDHKLDKNLIDTRPSKNEGICMAWKESWPTVIAIIAQWRYKTNLSNIQYVCDTNVDGFCIDKYSLENVSGGSGEGSELAIQAVLWDIYDSNVDTDDKIILGSEDFWNVTTEGKPKTFSEFVKYFYSKYPGFRYSLGYNLRKYGFTASFSVTNSGNASTPPTYTIHIGKGSTKCPLNSFTLKFFDANGNAVISSPTITSSNGESVSYTMSGPLWNNILYAYGTFYEVAVISYQTDSPSTGGYYSEKYTVKKPTPTPRTSSLVYSWQRKIFSSAFRLQPSQYSQYKIEFLRSGSYIFQTFGTTDAVIELYDSNGTRLDKSGDDDGYERNDFIRYEAVRGEEYTVKVRLYNSNESGYTRLIVTPTQWLVDNSSPTGTIEKFEDIWTVTGRTSYSMGTSTYSGNVKALVFNPSADGTYVVQTTGSIDTFIYVLDPRSTGSLTENVDYNDNGGTDKNASLSIYLRANVPYIIFYSAGNINDSAQVGSTTLSIAKK